MNVAHWPRMARLWHLVQPPLRPAAEDLVEYRQAIDLASPRAGRGHGLILGVTPELHGIGWPADLVPLCVDRAGAMVDHVWPGPREAAVRGSWTALPLAGQSIDVVACDGGLGMLAYPHGQSAVLGEVARVLRPGGVFVVRLFSPRGRTGNIEEVFRRLDAGQVPNLDSLKLMLWGALHGSPEEGVRPRDLVAALLARFGDLDTLAARLRWPVEHVRTLDFHRASLARYCLTEADEVVRLASTAEVGLQLARRTVPNYPLGSSCPILTFRRPS